MLMNDVIVIKDLNLKYNDKIVLSHLNLSVKNNTWFSILSPSGGGKTSLLKVIAGQLKTEAYISVDGELLNNKTTINNQTKIGTIFENQKPLFLFDTVYDELSYPLECLGYDEEDIYETISMLFSTLEISYSLMENPNNLSFGNKQILLIIKTLIVAPKIILIDNILSSISERYRKNILKYLKHLQKTAKITIVQTTNNPEDTLYSDYIGVILDGKIDHFGKRDDMYNNYDVWNKLNTSLPFMVELSTKLKYYDLVDEVVIDMDEMVEKLWN